MYIIYMIVFEKHKFEATKKMLETSEERIKLLKSGLNIKTIEDLYLKNNNIKIICAALLREPVEFERTSEKKHPIKSEIAIDFSTDLCAELV